MWLLKVMAFLIMYLALFVAAIKFYLWSRRLHKKHQKKWGARFGLFFFLAPLILMCADWFLPSAAHDLLPPLQWIVGILDYTMQWFKQLLEPVLGFFGYQLVKPALSAILYATLGYILGSLLDGPSQTKPAKATPKKK